MDLVSGCKVSGYFVVKSLIAINVLTAFAPQSCALEKLDIRVTGILGIRASALTQSIKLRLPPRCSMKDLTKILTDLGFHP